MASDETRDAPGARGPIGLLAFLVGIPALAFVIFSGISTSSARIAASTQNNGFIEAGTVQLAAATSTDAVLFDAENLFPGAVTNGCIAFEYSGSAASELRATGWVTGGNGLDEYVELRLSVRPDGICPDDPNGDAALAAANQQAGRVVFDGLLTDFSQAHSSFATGVSLATLSEGDVIAVDARTTVLDDNAAAGREIAMSFRFESRPT